MTTDFLGMAGRSFLVMGVANKKSVAFHTARLLEAAGANVIYSVRSEARREQIARLVGDRRILVCDVEFEDQIKRLADQLPTDRGRNAAGGRAPLDRVR